MRTSVVMFILTTCVLYWIRLCIQYGWVGIGGAALLLFILACIELGERRSRNAAIGAMLRSKCQRV